MRVASWVHMRLTPFSSHQSVFQSIIPASFWDPLTFRAIFVAIFLLGLPLPGFAISTQPVSWADMSSLDLKPILKSDYGSEANLFDPLIDPSSYDVALSDADSLISPEFHVPKPIQNTVLFWLKIYTEFTTQHSVVFDQNHPEMIYEALDFRPLSKSSRNRVVYEILQKRQIKKTMALYRSAFAGLAKNPKPKNPTREQRIVLERIKSQGHKHTFQELSKNLRIQTGQRDNIVKGLLAAETYFHRIESLFQKTGIPVELSRLSLVESSFNLNSYSRVGAAGIWQFMPVTARSFLTMDGKHHIDERISPLKSSLAAAKLLKANFRSFDNWASAVTAYNHGMRGLPRKGDPGSKYNQTIEMFRLCNKSGPKKGVRSPLGWASKNYYSEFLAIVHAEAYRKLFYGEPPIQELQPIAFRKLETSKTSGLSLAKELGIEAQEFKRLNPDILKLHTPLPKGLWIAVPSSEDNISEPLKQKKLAYSK